MKNYLKLPLFALFAAITGAAWAATLSYSGYLPVGEANKMTVFSGVRLSDIGSTLALSGNVGGGWVASAGSATVCNTSSANGGLTVQFQRYDETTDGNFCKVVEVVFVQDGNDIKAYAKRSGYEQNGSVGTSNISWRNDGVAVADSSSANGYGVYDIALAPNTPTPTATLSYNENFPDVTSTTINGVTFYPKNGGSSVSDGIITVGSGTATAAPAASFDSFGYASIVFKADFTNVTLAEGMMLVSFGTGSHNCHCGIVLKSAGNDQFYCSGVFQNSAWTTIDDSSNTFTLTGEKIFLATYDKGTGSTRGTALYVLEDGEAKTLYAGFSGNSALKAGDVSRFGVGGAYGSSGSFSRVAGLKIKSLGFYISSSSLPVTSADLPTYANKISVASGSTTSISALNAEAPCRVTIAAGATVNVDAEPSSSIVWAGNSKFCMDGASVFAEDVTVNLKDSGKARMHYTAVTSTLDSIEDGAALILTGDTDNTGSLAVTLPAGANADELNVTVIRKDGGYCQGTWDGNGAYTYNSTINTTICGSSTVVDATYTNVNAYAYKDTTKTTTSPQSDATPVYNNSYADKTTGMYIRCHPYLNNPGQLLPNISSAMTLVVAGQMSATSNRIFLHLGNSNSGYKGLLIATTGNENEVLVAWNDASTVNPITTMTVPNAATARHVYAITKEDTTIDAVEKTVFTVYLDGTPWKSLTRDKIAFTGGAAQVGADFGGKIRTGTYKAVDQNDTSEIGYVNFIRIFGSVLDEATIKGFSASEEYPYNSPYGDSERAFAADGNWVESSSTPWTVKPNGGAEEAAGAPLDGSNIKISSSVAAGATVSVNLDADKTYEALTITGDPIAFEFAEGKTGVIKATGAITIGAETTIKAGALEVGGATKILDNGVAKLIFDYSDYDASGVTVANPQTTPLVLASMDKQEEGLVTCTVPTTQHRVYSFGYANGGYNLTITAKQATLTRSAATIDVDTFANALAERLGAGDTIGINEDVTVASLDLTEKDLTLNIPEGLTLTVTGEITGNNALVVTGAGTLAVPVGTTFANLTSASTKIKVTGAIAKGTTLFTITNGSYSPTTVETETYGDVHYTLDTETGAYVLGKTYWWKNTSGGTADSSHSSTRLANWTETDGGTTDASECPLIFDTAIFAKQGATVRPDADMNFNIIVEKSVKFEGREASERTFCKFDDASLTISANATASFTSNNGGSKNVQFKVYGKVTGPETATLAIAAGTGSSYSTTDFYGDASEFYGTVDFHTTEGIRKARINSYTTIDNQKVFDGSNATWQNGLTGNYSLRPSGNGASGYTIFANNSTVYKFGSFNGYIPNSYAANYQVTLQLGENLDKNSALRGSWYQKNANYGGTVKWMAPTATLTQAATNAYNVTLSGGGNVYVEKDTTEDGVMTTYVPQQLNFTDNGGYLTIDDDNAEIAESIVDAISSATGPVGFNVTATSEISAAAPTALSGASINKKGAGVLTLTGIASAGTVTVAADAGALILPVGVEPVMGSETVIDKSFTTGVKCVNVADAGATVTEGETVTHYSSAANAITAANTAAENTEEDSVVVTLLKPYDGTATLADKVVLVETDNAAFSGTLSGSGTIELAALRPAQTALATFTDWTGVVVLPADQTFAGHRFDDYGVEGSAVRLQGSNSGWLCYLPASDNAPNRVPAATTVDIPAGASLTVSGWSASFANTFNVLTGAGTFAVSVAADVTLNYSDYSAYFHLKDVSGFSGSLAVTEGSKAGIAVGANKPYQVSVADGGAIVLTSVDATLNATANPEPVTTVAGYYVKQVNDVYSLESYKTVRFVDEDGETVLQTTGNLKIGDEVSYTGETPTKAADAQYTYTFAGWTPEVATTVAGDATYKATYSSTVNTYTITWIVDETSDTTQVAYGTIPTYADPVKQYYTFTGWDPTPVAVDGAATYTATFSRDMVTVTIPSVTGATLMSATSDGGAVTPTGANTLSVPAGSTLTLTWQAMGAYVLAKTTTTANVGTEAVTLSGDAVASPAPAVAQDSDGTYYADVMTGLYWLVTPANLESGYLQLLGETTGVNVYGAYDIGYNAASKRYAKAVALIDLEGNDDPGYLTVQAALDAAENGALVRIKANNSEALTLANGKSVTINAKKGDVIYDYTAPVAEDATYKVVAGETVDGSTTFTGTDWETWTLSLGTHPNATVTGLPAAVSEGAANKTVSFTVAADATYKITAVKVDGVAQVGDNGTYTYTVSGDATVTVETELDVKTFTVVVPANTTVEVTGATDNGDGSYTATIGDMVTITYAAAGAYVAGGTQSQNITVEANTDSIAAPTDYTTTAAVAQVGTTYYASLDAAVDAAVAGDTVTLLQDITYGAEREVTVWTKPVSIDLGGHTLKTNSEVSKDANNNGYKAAAICYSIPQASAGSITISNGTIITAYGAGVYADDPGLTLTLSSLTIQAATVGTQATAEYSAAVRVTGGSKVVIESGSYSGAYAVAASNSGADFTIKGGTFSGPIFFSASTNSGMTKSIAVTGGTFTNSGFVNTNKGTMAVSGGTFDVAVPLSCCADGYIPQDNGAGTYGVEPGWVITWVVDGVSTTTNVAAGATPAYTGTPAKAEDEIYTYTFAGWTPAITVATADATYTAQFTPVAKAITFTVEVPANTTVEVTGATDNGDGTYTATIGDTVTITYAAAGAYVAGGTQSQNITVGANTESIAAPADYTTTAAVSQVGGAYYATLDGAIADATAGSTVTLLADVAAERTTISKNLTLDLGDKTLTGRVTISDGTVTVQNGTIAGRFDAYDDSNVTLASTATINGRVVVWGDGTYGETGCKTPTLNVYGTIVTTGEDDAIFTSSDDASHPVVNINAGSTVTAETMAVRMSAPGGVLTMNGGEIDSDKWGVFVTGGSTFTMNGGSIEFGEGGFGVGNHGNDTAANDTDTVITIAGGTISGPDTAVYHPGEGTLDITGGTITGKTGVEVRAGTLNIPSTSTAVITATGDFDESANGSGATVTGAAVAISQHTTNNPIAANIQGGTFNSTGNAGVAFYVTDTVNADPTEVAATVSGGTFYAPVVVADSAADVGTIIPATSTARFSDAEADGVPAGYELVLDEETNLYAIAPLAPIKSLYTWTANSVYYFPDQDPVPSATTQATVPKYKREGASSYVAVTDGDGITVTWTVTTTAATTNVADGVTCASVDESGLVTFTEPGSVKLWVQLTDAAGSFRVASKTVKYASAPAYVVSADGQTRTAYSSLYAAFNHAATGEKIVLGADAAVSNIARMTLKDGRALTLDLNGHTVTCSVNFSGTGSIFNIQSGSLSVVDTGTTKGGIAATGNGGRVFSMETAANATTALSIGEGVNVSSAKEVCVYLQGAATLTTAGNLTAASDFAICGNGTAGNGGTTVNVTGGTVTGDEIAIYQPQDGALNISGGTITGGTAVYVKSGSVNVTGGTLVGNGTLTAYTYNGSGANATGEALVIENCGYPGGVPTVSITGGTFTSANAYPVGSYTKDDSFDTVIEFISGGTFSDEVLLSYCANGYMPKDNGNGTYGVAEGTPVAQNFNTGVYYSTLASAVSEASAGDTITVLVDEIELTSTIEIDKNLTIDLGASGCDVIARDCRAFWVKAGAFTLTGWGYVSTEVSENTTLADSSSVIRVGSNDAVTSFTLGESVSVTSDYCYGITYFGAKKQTVVIDGYVMVHGTQAALSGNGSASYNTAQGGSDVTVNGFVWSSETYAIYSPETGTLTINGEVEGMGGIEVKAGTVTIGAGATITAYAEDGEQSHTASNNGTSTSGYAIAAVGNANYAGEPEVVINGGTITGFTIALAEANASAIGTVTAKSDALQIPEGYKWVETATEGVYELEACDYVAQVGDDKFESLAEAVAAAQDGDTVTLLADVSLTERLFVNAGANPAYAGSGNRYATTSENKALTLDLNGFDITTTSNIALAGGSLTITGEGTIETTEAGLAPIEVRGTGDLASKRTLTIGEDVVLRGAQYGLNVFGSNDAQKNVIDVTVDGTVDGTLFVLGNLKNAENEINIVVNGTVAASASTGSSPNVGIALNGNAAVTVNAGAQVSGDSGIEVRAGNLTVNGGTITATASEYSYTANGSGSTTWGAAISVAQHTTVLPTAVTLNGGTLVGVEKVYVKEVNTGMPDVTVQATAAYTQTAEIPEGYKWVETETEGVYELEACDYVAQVGTTKYESFAEAVAAAQDGDTVTLLADVSLTERLFVNAGANPAYAGSGNRYATTSENKALTLDLNGFDITTTSNIALAGGSLTITGEGTITTTAAGLAPVEVRGTGDLASKRTLTIGENVVLRGAQYGLNVFGSNDAQKNVIDVTVNGTVDGTLFVLGNLKNAENEINIVVNGTVAASASTGSSPNVGIALNGNAAVTVNNDAVVSGDSGIEVRAGSLTVNGGTITATASEYSYTANGSGSTTWGAAISVAQHTTVLPTAVTLNGGTLEGVEKVYVKEVNAGMPDVTVQATAAYTQTAEIPEGYKWVETETAGTYVLVEDEVVPVTDGIKIETIIAAEDGLNSDAETTIVLCEENGTEIGNQQSTATGNYVANDVSVTVGETKYFKVKQGTNESAVYGVTSPSTTKKLNIVSVPFAAIGEDAGDVKIAKILDTGKLNNGDKVYVYGTADDTYDVWQLEVSGNEKTWTPVTVVKVSDNATTIETTAMEFEEATVARGGAFWVEIAPDNDSQIVLIGQVASAPAMKTVEAGTAAAPKFTLCASPKATAFDLNGNGAFTGDIAATAALYEPGDTIQLSSDGGAPTTFYYMDGKWKHQVKSGFTKTWSEDSKIPAGTGFWYISRGGAPTIQW